MSCKDLAKTLSAATTHVAVARAALCFAAGKCRVGASAEVAEPLSCNLENGDGEGVLIALDAMLCNHEQLVERLETPGSSWLTPPI